MKKLLFLLFIIVFTSACFSQTAADSVTVTFRVYGASGATIFLPGEFNNWGNNSSGNISPSDTSKMTTYSSSFGAWLKTYKFKIKSPTDSRRLYADSVWQYKVNRGGCNTCWNADSLNQEQNTLDNGNSILRMSKLFWFQYYQYLTGANISRMTIGLVHANSDTITSILLSYGTTPGSTLTTVDITNGYNATTRILDTVLTTPIPKANYIRLVAFNNHGDSVVYSKGGYVWSYFPMPAYIKNGVTLPSASSHDSVSFRLRVSSKEYVLVRVAPAGQAVATATPIVMRHNTDNSNWWVNTKLPAGTYEYVFEIENGKQIFDPWGKNIGINGTKFTVGHEGLTDDNYTWHDGGYQRPPLNKLVVYEMNATEFAGGFYNLSGGNVKWSHLRNMIPYFDSLGINGIELMPVTDYGNVGASGFSWGYDGNSYFALEPSFGTPAEYKEFIDSAHAHGIAVIMDMVFNHLTESSTLWQMQASEALSPYFKLLSDKRPNEDDLGYFKDLDHWTPETQELIYSALKLWIDQYHVDGFRYDFTQGIGWNRFDTTKGILGWANKIAADYNNTIYQISEHLPESPALLYYSGLTSTWHDSFRDKIFDEARFRNVSLTDFENLILGLNAFASNDTPSVPSSFANRTEPVNATSNHDEQSLFFEMITFHGVDTATALLRDKLYATFMFASSGIPMLWEGIEFSAPRGWHDDNERLAYRPLEWGVYQTERGKSHFQYYHSLIMQRKNNPALYNGTLVKQYKYGTEKVLVWGFNDSNTGAQVQIIANLSSSSRTVTNVPWLSSGNWYDIFDQSIFVADSTSLDNFTILPYTARVFSNKSNADLGIPLGIEDSYQELPKSFTLSQNYPNPFNPTTTIHYTLPVQSNVTLKIYDVLGKEIALLVNDKKTAGVYNEVWNASKLSTGVYYYRLTTDAGTITKKLLLVR